MDFMARAGHGSKVSDITERQQNITVGNKIS